MICPKRRPSSSLEGKKFKKFWSILLLFGVFTISMDSLNLQSGCRGVDAAFEMKAKFFQSIWDGNWGFFIQDYVIRKDSENEPLKAEKEANEVNAIAQNMNKNIENVAEEDIDEHKENVAEEDVEKSQNMQIEDIEKSKASSERILNKVFLEKTNKIEQTSKHHTLHAWKWCKDPPTDLEGADIYFNSEECVAGKTANILISGTLNETINELFVRVRFKIASFPAVVITTDLCKEGTTCPLEPGFHTVQLKYKIPQLTFGDLTAHAVVYDGKAKEIACVDAGPVPIIRP